MADSGALIPADVCCVKIFPPIGIARVGDSGFDLESGKPDLESLEFFLPSEIPGSDALENGFRFREEGKRRETRVKRQVKEKLVRIQQELDLDPYEQMHREKLVTGGKTMDQIETALTDKFDDHHDRIKRQAVRFRVYAYNKDGENIGEITAKDGYKFTWTVHVANHKASYELHHDAYTPWTGALRNPDVEGDRIPEGRNRLIVDPGPKTISSLHINTIVNISGKFRGTQANGVDVHLGQLRTNEEGHLIFIGGAGYSRCVTNRDVPHPDILSELDSADWIDDICDGWVKVLVDHNNFSAAMESSSKATILSAPPKFAWGSRSHTTWYDLIADIYAKRSETQWRDDEDKGVEFYRDIWPVLRTTYAVSWTNKDAFIGVLGKGNFLGIEERLKSKGQENMVFRQAIFNRLRAPDYKVLAHASTRYMPRLSGNGGDAVQPGVNLPPEASVPPIKRFAALTALQYERFALWKDGKFGSNAVPWKDATELKDVELKYQPACLTLAALDHTIGDPLCPGIEVWRVAKDPRTYVLEVDTDKHRIDPPFRVDHEVMAPGYLTRGLSIPWQSDFHQCHTHWWPSIRPDDVLNERDFPKDDISETEFINTILPLRKSWARGMRPSPSGHSEYYCGATDMVRYWSRLGFVVKHKVKTIKREDGSQKDPTWLETEREKIVQKTRGPVYLRLVEAASNIAT